MSEPSEAAEYIVCPYCDDGEIATNDEEEFIICPQCEGQGEICDHCGAPPSYQIEDEFHGGCWCTY